MRKAKVAALIIGGVSTCIFGSVFGVIATSPIVKSVTPDSDVQSIYEVQSEELANVAAVTSIKATPQTTTSKNSYTVSVGTTTTTQKKGLILREDLPKMSISFNGAMSRPNYKEDKTEAPTQAPTQAPTYTPVATTSPVTAAVTTAAPITTARTTTTCVVTTEITTTVAPTEAPTQAPTYTEPVTEPPTEAPTAPPVVEETEPPTESVETVTPALPDTSVDSLPISDEEFIILCNAVAHEAGCNWISTYDKALVVEVIMNRVNSPLYPNSILSVLTQPYQFTGSSSYVYLGDYSHHVTQDVKDAVTLYFTETESFGHGYYSFYGDGYRNYFS